MSFFNFISGNFIYFSRLAFLLRLKESVSSLHVFIERVFRFVYTPVDTFKVMKLDSEEMPAVKCKYPHIFILQMVLINLYIYILA